MQVDDGNDRKNEHDRHSGNLLALVQQTRMQNVPRRCFVALADLNNASQTNVASFVCHELRGSISETCLIAAKERIGSFVVAVVVVVFYDTKRVLSSSNMID
jgi:hypothetical protein